MSDKQNRKANIDEIQHRSGEIKRMEEVGLVTAYLTRWDSVDSYNSTFERGAFLRSFSNRNEDRIRFLFNHSDLCGHIVSVGEDDYGPWVRAQFNLETQAGKDAYAHVKAGDVNAFSFGFYQKKAERNKEGVLLIREIDMIECGPVVFEANEQAKITEVRAADYQQTKMDFELATGGANYCRMLMQTLEDIQWDLMPDQWEEAAGKAIAGFRKDYLKWIKAYVEASGQRQSSNSLADALHEDAAGRTIKELALESPFAEAEIRSMISGEPVITNGRAKQLSIIGKKTYEANQLAVQNEIERLFYLLKTELTDDQKAELRKSIGFNSEKDALDTENDILHSELEKLKRQFHNC